MAPQVRTHPGTRPTGGDPVAIRSVTASDPTAYAAQRQAQEELLAAAITAMRFFQDRQQHTPEEMLDARERKVLRRLRDAVRDSLEERR
jgi:hypothetical protein